LVFGNSIYIVLFFSKQKRFLKYAKKKIATLWIVALNFLVARDILSFETFTEPSIQSGPMSGCLG
jgi:uncharacterized membrane protein